MRIFPFSPEYVPCSPQWVIKTVDLLYALVVTLTPTAHSTQGIEPMKRAYHSF